MRLLVELVVTRITDSNLLRNAEVWQGHGLGRTSLVEDLTTVATMVLAVRERERCPAAKANVRINPFRRCLSVHHC